MERIINRFCGLAAVVMLAASCTYHDMDGFYRFNDIEFDKPVTSLDIDWRDGRVEIFYWDQPSTRVYDDADPSCPTYCRLDGRTLVVRYSNNNFKNYNKSLTVCLPKDRILDYCDIEAVSAKILADVDAKSIDIESVSGNVCISTWYQPYSIDVETTSGNVEIALPLKCGFDCDFDTVSGYLGNEFRTAAVFGGNIRYLDGYTDIDVETVSGDLDLLINYPAQ